MSDLQPEYRRVSLAVKYVSVLFPFDVAQFAIVLSRQGFFIPESLEEGILVSPPGARIDASGIVAKRGDLAVRVDMRREIFAVHSLDPNTALEEMESLESLLMNEFGVDSPGAAQYYEFIAALSAKATASPLDSWAAQFSEVPAIQEASRVLGREVSAFGVRLVPTGQPPNEIDWFDIRIQPQLSSPERYHYLDVVFRDSDRGRVASFVGGFDEILRGLVALAEGGSVP